jgi:hypothetical protein
MKRCKSERLSLKDERIHLGEIPKRRNMSAPILPYPHRTRRNRGPVLCMWIPSLHRRSQQTNHERALARQTVYRVQEADDRGKIHRGFCMSILKHKQTQDVSRG